MPQITSGSNATFTVPSGYVIDVQCPGGWIQLEFPVGTKVFEGNPAGQTFGPYSGGSAKLTSVKGDIYYEVDPTTGGDRPYDPSSVDIRGGVIAGNKLLRINNGTRQLRVIPFGDSITQNGTVFVNGLWQFSNGYPETSIYQAGARFQIIRNAGIAGNTTTQMLARIGTDVLAYSPDVVLMLGGTNDLVSGMTNAQIAATMSNLESMTRQMLQAGILPIIVTPPPKNAAALESRKIQLFYYALAQAYGVPLLDTYRLLVDPTTGNYQASLSGDGLHPNATGVATISAVASQLLTNLQASFAGPYLAAYSENSDGQFLTNLLRNGNFARAASAPTPDNWSVTATNATQTLVAATPGYGTPSNGNTFNYVKSATGSIYALFGGLLTPASAGYAAGDVLQFSGHVNVSGLTPASATGFSVGLDMTPAGNARPFTNCPFNGDFTFCHQLTVPAGTTQFSPTFVVNDAATFKVNNLTVVNVTLANAIWQPAP